MKNKKQALKWNEQAINKVGVVSVIEGGSSCYRVFSPEGSGEHFIELDDNKLYMYNSRVSSNTVFQSIEDAKECIMKMENRNRNQMAAMPGDYIHQLWVDTAYGKRLIIATANKQMLVDLIERVRAYDLVYLKAVDENTPDFNVLDYDKNHPLDDWREDLACEESFIHNLDDMDGKTWADSMYIDNIKLY